MANANIFQSYLQPPKSVLEYTADLDRADMSRLALEGRRGENALLQLTRQQKADEAQQQMQDRNALQRIASGWGADTTPEQRAAGLRASGRPGLMTQADAIEKASLDRRKTEADITKIGADAKGTDTETLVKQLGVLKTLSAGVMANPTVESAAFALDAFERLTGQQMPEERQRLAMLQTPEQVKQWAAGHALQADKLLPQIQTRNTGGSTDTLAVDPVTGKATVTNSVKNTASPDALVSASTARRGQDLTDAREREQPKGVLDTERGLLVNPRTGEASPITVGGKPVGSKKPTEGEQKVNDAKDVLSLLDDAEKLVDKATSSYAGAASDQALRAFGVSTGGAEAAAQLRALEGSLISKMPKMSGPQSDKDVLLYKQMAGQIGDPTIPAGTKKAAMKTIREINERHAGVSSDTKKTVVRTGTLNGRKVVQYSDGTTDYAD